MLCGVFLRKSDCTNHSVVLKYRQKEGTAMKIVLTDAQTVVDELVSADPLKELGEVVSYGLLRY